MTASSTTEVSSREQALQTDCSEHRTLKQVLQWAHSRTPSQTIADIVVQDEYTHDVVVPDGDGRFVVYDTT